MKLLPLAAACLLLASFAGVAAASHGDHPPCGPSTLSTGNSYRVDVWLNNACVGVVGYSNVFSCLFWFHVDWLGLHVMALHDEGCQTGALAELP